MGDTRTEQDRQLERKIFGYIDEHPPIPGSYKAEVLSLSARAKAAGLPDSAVVEPFKAAITKMYEAQTAVIDTLIKIM